MVLNREKFHTFDALRFFSFFLVFLSHQPYWLYPSFDFMQTRGDIGVSFFFTLSGFLITYLILAEKESRGNFDFRKYMARRILRIWPLYYLVLLFAFFTPVILGIIGLAAGNEGYEPNWFLSAAFLENYMVIYHRESANVSPLPVIWSLCIEEHFYVIWGLVLYYGKVRNLPIWIGGIIFLAVLSRIIFDCYQWPFKDIFTNFDAFMYGAVPAWLYANHREKVIAKVSSIPIFLKILWIGLTVCYCLGAYHFDYPLQQFTEPVLIGLLFMGILFLMLPKENRLKISDANLFSKLGVYTYGLYMFNVIAINFVIRLYPELGLHYGDVATMLLFFCTSLGVTIIASVCSYHFFEKFFLKLKPR